MSDPKDESLFIDSDWKEEARREKERLAEAEKSRTTAGEESEGPRFEGLIDILVMQTMVALGGVVGPGGQPTPINFGAARYFIDLLGLLEEKTRGNLTDEETQTLGTVLTELRREFVRLTGTSASAGRSADLDPADGK